MNVVKTLLWASLLLGGGVTAAALIALPEAEDLKVQYPRVEYRGPKQPPLIALQASAPPGWTRLGEVSKAAVGAVLVSEDWAFWSHAGFDWEQIKEAAKEDWEAGAFVRGASTITQQVAKNVFLSRRKTLGRKLQELFLAVQLERKVGKPRILEVYLNIAEWGEGVFGIRQAARHYFDKSPSALTPKEGAFLAMLLPSPKRYSQSFRSQKLSPFARGSIHRILDKMVRAGYLSETQRDQEKAAFFAFETRPERQQAEPTALPTSADPGPGEEETSPDDEPEFDPGPGPEAH